MKTIRLLKVCFLMCHNNPYEYAYLNRRDRMVVEFTTTCVIGAYHLLSAEFEPHSWRSVIDKTLCNKVFQ
jgi:hypothetical protein